MIEKITNQNQIARHKLAEKINELIDIIEELDDAITATMDSVNIHEKQIDELQMKLEPEKCETADPYAEQRKWIGKLCRFWDGKNPKDYAYGTLIEIDEYGDFKCDTMTWFNHCEPVSPEDDIIYKKD